MRDDQGAFVAVTPRHLRVRRTVAFGAIRVSLAALLIGVGAAFGVIAAASNGIPFITALQAGSVLAASSIILVEGRIHRRPALRMIGIAARYAVRQRRRRVRL